MQEKIPGFAVIEDGREFIAEGMCEIVTSDKYTSRGHMFLVNQDKLKPEKKKQLESNHLIFLHE